MNSRKITRGRLAAESWMCTKCVYGRFLVTRLNILPSLHEACAFGAEVFVTEICTPWKLLQGGP